MARTLSSRGIFLLTVSTLVAVLLADCNDKTVNAPEYIALCKLYRLAKEGENLQEAPWVKERLQDSHPENILADVTGLFNELNITEESKKIVDMDGRVVEIKRNRFFLKQLQRMDRVVRLLSVLNQEARQLVNEAESKVREAKSQSRTAILGSWSAEEVENSKLSGTARAAFCKKNGVGASAGENLIVDLTCLCATSAANNDYLCGFQAGTGSSSAWASSGGGAKAIFDSSWTTIKADCIKHRQPHLTPWVINQSLAVFESLIGRQTEARTTGAGESRYLLGRPHTGGECGSANADTGCVDYGGAAPKTERREPTKWEAALHSLGDDLRQAAEKIDKIHKINARMEQLRDLAQGIFNETILETQFSGALTGLTENPKQNEKTTDSEKAKTLSTDSQLAQNAKTLTFSTALPVLLWTWVVTV